MTQEQKNAIFQEYFRTTKIMGSDIYCGDLSITSVGLNSETQHNLLCFKRGLEMEVLSDNFHYGDIEIMDGGLDDEEKNDNDRYVPIRKLLKGELKQWKLVSIVISDNGNDGEHFINFIALHTDIDGYKIASRQGKADEWYAQNICAGMYFDHNNFTLFSIDEGETVYLMHSSEDVGSLNADASFVEVTEFINYRKTRTFHRWFYKRESYDNSWKVTYFAT